MMDLVHIWYDDRYWSKILHSTIPTPIHDLKVKVTDLEINLYHSFCWNNLILCLHNIDTLNICVKKFDAIILIFDKMIALWT